MRLETQGVSIEELRTYSQTEEREENYTSAWQKAGEEFQKANPDWAGGDNFQVMLNLIQSSPTLLNDPICRNAC